MTKDGKRGYQPVCRNRWSIECKAHKYKCEGCAHRDLVPLDDAIIRRHLHKGAKETDIIGLFPIMEDTPASFFAQISMTRTASMDIKMMCCLMSAYVTTGTFRFI